VTESERSAAIAARLEEVVKAGFDATCAFTPVRWGDGQAVVAMAIAPAVQNVNGALHGGATAALIDHAGTLAIITADRDCRAGVTTDLNVTYLAPGPGGDTAMAEARVLKVGKIMAYVTVDVRRKSDGVLIAQGRMTKFQGA
jgi:acyl-coenzyme A thioesterase 13